VEDLAEATLALYQGTALAGPYPRPLMRASAPEVRFFTGTPGLPVPDQASASLNLA
jgi:hypothetical protein